MVSTATDNASSDATATPLEEDFNIRNDRWCLTCFLAEHNDLGMFARIRVVVGVEPQVFSSIVLPPYLDQDSVVL